MNALSWSDLSRVAAIAAALSALGLALAAYPYLWHSMTTLDIFFPALLTLSALGIVIYALKVDSRYQRMGDSARAAFWFTLASGFWLVVYAEWLEMAAAQHVRAGQPHWPITALIVCILAGGIFTTVFMSPGRARVR